MYNRVFKIVFIFVCLLFVKSDIYAEQYSREQSMELVKQQFITEIINKTGNPVVYSEYGLSQDEAISCFYDAIDEYADLMYIDESYYISETTLSGYLKSEEELLDAESKQETLKNKVSEVIALTNDKSDYEKVSIIYNWLCDNCTYNGYSCDIYDAMLNGGTNCVGFSSTFNYLCIQAGLEAHRVWSPIHVFSQVKVDGEWYNCDVTWDIDKEEKLYFLCSDEKFLLSHECITQTKGCTSKKYDYIEKDDSNLTEETSETVKKQEKEVKVKVEKYTNQDNQCKSLNIKDIRASISSAKKKGKSIIIKLSKPKGYNCKIAISTDKKFKKSVKYYKTSKTTYSIKKLKKKTYYIKVRVYKKVGENVIYGKWSKVKKVKIK